MIIIWHVKENEKNIDLFNKDDNNLFNLFYSLWLFVLLTRGAATEVFGLPEIVYINEVTLTGTPVNMFLELFRFTFTPDFYCTLLSFHDAQMEEPHWVFFP